jgi:hypothetical protein
MPPEYLAPVLTVVGVPAVVFVVMRSFPHAARGAVVLLASIVAIMTQDPKRRGACYKVLDVLTRRDSMPEDSADLISRTPGIAKRSRHNLPLP